MLGWPRSSSSVELLVRLCLPTKQVLVVLAPPVLKPVTFETHVHLYFIGEVGFTV